MTPETISNMDQDIAVLDKKYEIEMLKVESFFNQYKKDSETNAYAYLIEHAFDQIPNFMSETAEIMESRFASTALANYMVQNKDKIDVKYDLDKVNKKYADSIIQGDTLIKDIEKGVDSDAKSSSLLMNVLEFLKGPGVKMAQKGLAIHSFKKNINFVETQAKKVDKMKEDYKKKKDKLTPEQSKSILDVIEKLYSNTKSVANIYKSAQSEYLKEQEDKRKEAEKEYKKNLPKDIKKIKF